MHADYTGQGVDQLAQVGLASSHVSDNSYFHTVMMGIFSILISNQIERHC